MPRPGPRPYECIRRAWHSDSHQPLRGALIQEIFRCSVSTARKALGFGFRVEFGHLLFGYALSPSFCIGSLIILCRVVNELHSTSTRRKKEWQEKLPIVVLRAEEILYSKANSESEYAGVETLRARLDDAVNTMIRREDTEEEGVYLAPCVEAALSLGCTPKKVPRGQRQVSSRLLPSGARRSSVACANDGGYRAMSGKGRSVYDKSSSSAPFVLGAQNAQMQDQGLNTALPMETSTLYSSIGPPSGPIACYTPSPGSIFPQTFTLPTSFEASHPLITPSFPQLGGLVQFLKGTGPGTHTGLQGMVPFQQMHINANNDPRVLQYVDSLSCSGSRTDAHFVCRELNPSVCMPSTVSSPASSISRSCLDVGRDGCTESDHLVRSTLGGATDISARNNRISTDTTTTTQMQETAIASDIFPVNTRQILGFSTTPDRWRTCPVPRYRASPSSPSSYRASPLQRSSPTSLSSIKVDASSHACTDDLQLRLGPPGKDATKTSGMAMNALTVTSGGTSALKRSRVDNGKLDVSASSAEQFQLCGLPLPQQLTWSRG